MRIKELHLWDLSAGAAVALQKELAGQVELAAFCRPVRIVAGLDCALSRDRRRIAAVAVVMRLPALELVEQQEAVMAVSFPYVPGLLSFREAPVCLEAMRKLSTQPDAVLVDGQGIAHPRRLGLACHLGLFLDCPTIGCAKSRLIGTFQEPPQEKGCFTPLMDKSEQVGAVVRTKHHVKPLFVSPGHKISPAEAIAIVLQCCTRYRLPEPTRLAHHLVGRLKHFL